MTARRILGVKPSGGKVEALLLGPGQAPGTYRALLKPARSLRKGARINFPEGIVEVVSEEDGGFRDLMWIERRTDSTHIGEIPLPPYLKSKLSDEERYQTVFAREGGSAAAPTAGLHMTQEVFNELARLGIQVARVSLDIGIDTFRPVQVENIGHHQMHGETCRISATEAKRINATKGKVVAIGTTTVRTLESMAIEPRHVSDGEVTTNLYIRPGYEFKVVDAIVTNFHMPRSSLLIMLAAFCPLNYLLYAYGQAVKENYRFLSFGDAMLIV